MGEVLPYSVAQASAISTEVRALSPARRRVLGVSDTMLVAWDLLILAARLLTDDNDPRPWMDRLAEEFGPILDPDDEDARVVMNGHLASLVEVLKDEFVGWHEALDKEDRRRFLLRAVGAAAFDRLTRALRSDGAMLVVALRRGSRVVMPFAVALDDVALVLTPEQLAGCLPLGIVQGSLLDLALQLDKGLDDFVGMGLVLEAATARPEEVEAMKVEDLVAFAGELRQVVSGRSREEVAGLSAALARKMQGAKDALEHSADPVSQASSSIIELIDRLLRTAFTDQEVLDWVRDGYPNDPSMTVVKDGRVVPSKRAQAFCFTYAGQHAGDRNAVNEIVAVGIVAARRSLQQLKHADTGSAEETAALVRYLAAVEGSLHMALSIGWALAPDEGVRRLRARFDAA